MNKTIFKSEEWRGSSGRWYVNDVHHLTSWRIHKDILGLTTADFIIELYENFAASLSYSKDKKYLHFCFNNQNDARLYKNYINKIAREKQYLLEER